MTISNLRVEVKMARLYQALSLLAPNTQSGLAKFMTAFAVRFVNQVKTNVADIFLSTGPLYQSINVYRRGGTIVVSSDLPYARILEEGGVTRPHMIVPRNVSVLMWEGPAGLVFAKQVNHPGSRFPARPYMRLALTQLRGEFDDGIRGVVAKAKEEML